MSRQSAYVAHYKLAKGGNCGFVALGVTSATSKGHHLHCASSLSCAPFMHAQCTFTTRSNSQVCSQALSGNCGGQCSICVSCELCSVHICIGLCTSVFACTHLCVCCLVNSTHTDVFLGIKWQLWWGVLHLYQDPSPLAGGTPSLCQYIHLSLLSGNTALCTTHLTTALSLFHCAVPSTTPV